MDCLIFGNHTQGIGIIRSLGSTKYNVQLVNDKKIGLSRFSKYLKKYHSLPRHTITRVYEDDTSTFLVSAIKDIVPQRKRVVFFCVHEDLVNFIYQKKAELQDYLIIPENRIDLITDKYRFAQEMLRIGISHPKTLLLSECDQAFFGKETEYLWKGRIGNKLRNRMGIKGAVINSKVPLFKLQAQIGNRIGPNEVLIQEKLSLNKEVMHCCGLAIDGELFRLFQYVKLRQHPDEFGTGTFLQSIRNDDLTDLSKQIISHFSYTGIFEIEFVTDESGNYIVIEMNPRTWKSINFATECKQNMCTAYCDYIIKGITPARDFFYDVGKYWVDIGTDLPMLIKQRKLPDYWKCSSFCVLSAKDPLPFLMEIILAPLIKLGL